MIYQLSVVALGFLFAVVAVGFIFVLITELLGSDEERNEKWKT